MIFVVVVFSSLTLHLTQLHRKPLIWFNGHHHEIQIQNCRNLCVRACVWFKCEFARVNIHKKKTFILCLEKRDGKRFIYYFQTGNDDILLTFFKKKRTHMIY